MAGAAGGAVAELTGNHDAVAIGIENGASQPGQIVGPGAVGGGNEDQVGAIGIELADLQVVDLGIRDGLAAAQWLIPEMVLPQLGCHAASAARLRCRPRCTLM